MNMCYLVRGNLYMLNYTAEFIDSNNWRLLALTKGSVLLYLSSTLNSLFAVHSFLTHEGVLELYRGDPGIGYFTELSSDLLCKT